MEREPRAVVPATIATGKIAHSVFEDVIFRHLGAPRPEVLVGPRHGVDAGIVDLGGGQVLAVTTDPFFVMPEVGWERAAWFAVHIVASDAATTGLMPAYLTVDLNLPPHFSDDALRDLWLAIDTTCRGIGVAVVTGHTGRYEGCSFPMVGGATVLSVGQRDRYVTPGMARPGDVLVLTKGAAIETTGTFGAVVPDLLRRRLGSEVAAAADALFDEMSVVRDAIVAAAVGVRDDGVTAMHDATERGVQGALVEVAEAAGTGVAVDRDAIPVRPETHAVCGLFSIDPYVASSEGTLLIACRPHRAGELIARLEDAEIPAARIGELTTNAGVYRWTVDGVEQALEHPAVDPFWPALESAIAEEQR